MLHLFQRASQVERTSLSNHNYFEHLLSFVCGSLTHLHLRFVFITDGISQRANLIEIVLLNHFEVSSVSTWQEIGVCKVST